MARCIEDLQLCDVKHLQVCLEALLNFEAHHPIFDAETYASIYLYYQDACDRLEIPYTNFSLISFSACRKPTKDYNLVSGSIAEGKQYRVSD